MMYLKSMQSFIVLQTYLCVYSKVLHFFYDIFIKKAKIVWKISSNNYWSSTSNANNSDNAWNVNFNNGNTNNNNKSNTDNVINSPKLREVFSANFSDRVVHHLVVLVLEQIFEPKFIYDSYSNRVNKGTHKACKRAVKFSKATKYYLQLDIKNFFYTIQKDILFAKLEHSIKKDYYKVKNTTISKDEMLWLVHKIIYQDVTQNVCIKSHKKAFENVSAHKSLFKIDKSKGLPIGNLTSQFFANVYMNSFDNFVKRELKCKYYLRYVDDFVLFSNSKEELLLYLEKIKEYLKVNLNLSLRDNFILKQNHQGLNFLGYIIRPYYTLSRKRVVNNYKYKKALFLNMYEKSRGEIKLEYIKKFLNIRASFLGHIKHSNAYKLKNRIGEINDEKYIQYFSTTWNT